MFRISTRGQYALLVMADLVEQNPEKYVPLKLLSHRRNLSVKYLEQILMVLAKAGLVCGMRGNTGGYRLAKSPSEYTVGEILRATEGDLSPKGSVQGNTVSSVGNDLFWKEFGDCVNAFVDGITLEQLSAKNREFNGFDYCI